MIVDEGCFERGCACHDSRESPGVVVTMHAAELRRLQAVNHELGAALRRLISYCNTLENRLMEADGEHPALQEAKEAYAKVEGQACLK